MRRLRSWRPSRLRISDCKEEGVPALAPERLELGLLGLPCFDRALCLSLARVCGGRGSSSSGDCLGSGLLVLWVWSEVAEAWEGALHQGMSPALCQRPRPTPMLMMVRSLVCHHGSCQRLACTQENQRRNATLGPFLCGRVRLRPGQTSERGDGRCCQQAPLPYPSRCCHRGR